MSETQKYREQHLEIESILSKIEENLSVDGAAKDPAAMRKLLERLEGKLSFHLVMEDRSLYPRLLTSADQKLKETAERFQRDMGHILPHYEEYKLKWKQNEEIVRNAIVFVSETKTLIRVIRRRAEQEDKELYPLIDSLN